MASTSRLDHHVPVTRSDSFGDHLWMANLSVEEPDALMCARPGLWEPWWVTARATQPAAGYGILTDVGDGSLTAWATPRACSEPAARAARWARG